MTFDSDIAQAGSDLIAKIATDTSATFIPLAGSPVTPCAVFLDTEEDLQPIGFESTAQAQVTTIRYLLSEAGKVAERNESFIVNGVSYTVESVAENPDKDGVVKVIVK